MADKRRFTRLHSNFIVRIRGRRPTTFETLDLESRITNISLGGVFIETPSPFDQGTVVELEFTIPRYADRVHVRGIVRWSGRTAEGAVGMGIEFLEVVSSRDAVRGYVDDRVRSEDLAPLVETPAAVRLLRLHAQRCGQRHSLEALGKLVPAPLEELLETVARFEHAGLVQTSGEEVLLQECSREDLRDAIRQWLAAHP